MTKVVRIKATTDWFAETPSTKGKRVTKCKPQLQDALDQKNEFLDAQREDEEGNAFNVFQPVDCSIWGMNPEDRMIIMQSLEEEQ